jgi:cephalosporin hydroxylase
MNKTLENTNERIPEYNPSDFTRLDEEWKRLVGYWNYYRWLWAAIAVTQPSYVVEIGRERGVSANIILGVLPKDSKLVSIDINEESIFLNGVDDPRLTLITKDSKEAVHELASGIDFLFVDGEHTKEQVTQEWALYKPKLAPNAIVVFDDIHFDEGMTEFWDSLEGEKYDISEWHERGFGVLFT